MLTRTLGFILCQLLGGLLGWYFLNSVGALLGTAMASLTWFLYDQLRALRVLQWLRQGAGLTKVPRMKGLWAELTERTYRALRAREQQIHESDHHLQEFLAAIQASPNGVILLDPQGCIEWCNQTAATHFGIDPQRDLQQLIANLIRDPDFAAYYTSSSHTQDVIIHGRHHTVMRPVKLAVHLHAYGEGRKMMLSRDVTALEQAEAMRRDFVANVSHEIRTPLTVLSGFVESLQTLPLSEAERHRFLGLMAQQADRMQTLVKDLLTLSKLEGSPTPGNHQWTVVASLMTQCEQEAHALSQFLSGPESGHHLHFELNESIEIVGSNTELHSAFSNLISNAIRYTPPGGDIEIKWQKLPHEAWQFSVKDTGPGIAAEHIARLTERFYRVDQSRSRETGGTGLGLAIVKHVAQRHGAQLHIESTVGVGSTFALEFAPSRVRVCNSSHE